MMTVNRIWLLLAALFALVGMAIGYALSARQSYATAKLLYIVAASSNLLGLLVASYFVIASARLKSFLADWVTVCVGHFICFLSLGMFVSASASWLGGLPSAGKTASLAFSAFFYGAIPVSVLEDFVLIPKRPRFSSDEVRLKFLGAFLLIGGLLVQLVAAFLDFNS